jgi:hypothetical protein
MLPLWRIKRYQYPATRLRLPGYRSGLKFGTGRASLLLWQLPL